MPPSACHSLQLSSCTEQLSAAQQSCREALHRATGTEAGLVVALRAKEELRVVQDQERGRMAESLVCVCVYMCVRAHV
jgi:hypothetical protein